MAQRDGTRLIAVTLNGVAPDDWYDDNRVLLDFGFDEAARRQATGGNIIGDVVRYRDPDAARILSMASAGGEIGVPRALVVAAPTSRAVPAPEIAKTGAVTGAVVAKPEAHTPVLIPVAQSGASGSGLIAAASVAAALILVQGVSTWRLQSRRPTLAATPLSSTPATAESL